MKAFVHTIAVILLFASCCTNTAKGNGIETFSMVDGVGGIIAANIAAGYTTDAHTTIQWFN